MFYASKKVTTNLAIFLGHKDLDNYETVVEAMRNDLYSS